MSVADGLDLLSDTYTSAEYCGHLTPRARQTRRTSANIPQWVVTRFADSWFRGGFATAAPGVSAAVGSPRQLADEWLQHGPLLVRQIHRRILPDAAYHQFMRQLVVVAYLLIIACFLI
jgi:hypothetical protein